MELAAGKSLHIPQFRRMCIRFPAQQTVQVMNETLPDRLSVNPRSPHYDEALLARGIGIRFNGNEKTNVEEYCVSEGWIRVTAGKVWIVMAIR